MNQIQNLLTQLGISTYTLARILDVKQPTISRYANGYKPSRKMADKIIKFAATEGIEITYEQLFAEEG